MGSTLKNEQMKPNTQRVPLRLIVDRPHQMQETLECGHTIARSCSLGENLMVPSKAVRRRCYKCGEM